MALSIKHPEADRLARRLAHETGESLTEAVTKALRERFIRETGTDPDTLEAVIESIVTELKLAPDLDDRTDDEIIGYDEFGLPS